MGTPKVEIPGPTRCVGCCHTSRALGPRVLASAEVPAGALCPPEVRDLWKAGTGYGIHIDFPQAAVRRWSEEAKANVRCRNLVARVQKAAPLFADELIERELAARPNYCAGKRIGAEPD